MGLNSFFKENEMFFLKGLTSFFKKTKMFFLKGLSYSLIKVIKQTNEKIQSTSNPS